MPNVVLEVCFPETGRLRLSVSSLQLAKNIADSNCGQLPPSHPRDCHLWGGGEDIGRRGAGSRVTKKKYLNKLVLAIEEADYTSLLRINNKRRNYVSSNSFRYKCYGSGGKGIIEFIKKRKEKGKHYQFGAISCHSPFHLQRDVLK